MNFLLVTYVIGMIPILIVNLIEEEGSWPHKIREATHYAALWPWYLFLIMIGAR